MKKHSKATAKYRSNSNSVCHIATVSIYTRCYAALTVGTRRGPGLGRIAVAAKDVACTI